MRLHRRPSSSSDVARSLFLRILPLILAAALAQGCKPREFIPDAPPSISLREFDRLEIQPLSTTGTVVKGVPDDLKDRLTTFASTFPAELRPRVYRKHILNASSGRLLILQGTVTRYELTGVVTNPAPGNASVGAQIEMEMTLTAEGGKRIGGGKASAFSNSISGSDALDIAEKRIAAAVADYLRKSVKEGDKAPAEPSDNP